ncbi:hypothetical protein V1511DRAFT_499762 [Dipodascopsis uninucleata]
MIFGPAMFPMVFFLGKLLWGEYTKRPPLWTTYEPEPFPEVVYMPSICQVNYPDVFGGCEDIKVYGDLAIVSCDPYKKQSNFLTGYHPGVPDGKVYVWKYETDEKPIEINVQNEFGEFRPQGVRGVPLPEENALRIFISNAAKNASVEVLDYDLATGVTSKVVSLRHKDAILDPNGLAPISSTQVFIANTLGYPYSTLYGPLEFISAIPFGTLGFLDFSNMTNITGKAVGGTTTPIGLEYHDEQLYVASLQYGIYSYRLYIPPDDIDPELVAENKSLGKMHFYPGENVYRTPYLPTHITYSSELDGIVSAGINSYSGEVKAWFGGRSSSWAGLLVDRKGPDEQPLVVSDTVTLGLRSSDRKWQTLFWDKGGENFSGMQSMVVENGRRFGVSPHQAGVLICKSNGIEAVEDTRAVKSKTQSDDASASTGEKRSNDKLEHMYLAKDEL